MKTKKEKAQIILELKELLENYSTIILISLLKLKGEEQKIFKDSIKKEGGVFKVFKKTLIKKAIPNFPLDLELEEFKQPFGMLFFKDNLQIFKKLLEFSKNFQINIIKGILGNRILTKEEILEIGELPSIEVLRSKLIYSLKNPFQELCFTLKNPFIKLNMVVSNIKKFEISN